MTRPPSVPLSPRETEFLRLADRGLEDRAIATVMGISPHTVNHYADSARLKLGARTRTHAVALALRAGIIE